MKIVMTGNRNKDLCAELVKLFESRGHECVCLSRETGFDFEENPYGTIGKVLEVADDCDIFINLYANFFFNASVLAHKLFNRWFDKGWSDRRIINIGSTTDRVQRGKTNIYHYEKRALREMSSGHSMLSVWDGAPKVTHISFGTMENRQKDNPDRKCLGFDQVAQYIYWITEQPVSIHINELSLDPVQV